MTARTFAHHPSRKASRSLVLPVVLLAALVAGATTFVSYELWPTWPKTTVPLDAPAIPVTVAGVLFNVPPAAIRTAVQRHPGAHERIDLAFLWPSLAPPEPSDAAALKSVNTAADEVPAVPSTDDRIFVSIAALGAALAPAARLRTIYPRYMEPQATAGADGLAIVAFRAGTPYEGEDLVYLGDKPEEFFARCSRAVRSVPGTCIHERSIDAAVITLRFPRQWLQQDWRNVAAGFDRLMARLHSPSEDGRQKTDNR
ncbi:MAG TPA: hypothetical protein VEJ37_02770 [Xanthobacteraceae bacterium]|nr:hypothetical protein [Xanthobacteraceae bacterium]